MILNLIEVDLFLVRCHLYHRGDDPDYFLVLELIEKIVQSEGNLVVEPFFLEFFTDGIIDAAAEEPELSNEDIEIREDPFDSEELVLEIAEVVEFVLILSELFTVDVLFRVLLIEVFLAEDEGVPLDEKLFLELGSFILDDRDGFQLLFLFGEFFFDLLLLFSELFEFA